jgi:hypothetical protein
MTTDQEEHTQTEDIDQQEGASRALVLRGELSRLPEPLQDKIFALHRRIALLLERRQGSVVQFASAQREREGSKIVLELAKLTAQRLDRKVLLFAIGPVPYALPNGTGQPPSDESWESSVRSGILIEEQIHTIEGTSLSFCQIGSSAETLPAILDNPRFDAFINLLRSRFDMVLVDCPSMAESTIAARIASISDGVVLIVDAGKTRWQVIKNQIREIQANRGSVLGVVLNKRKFYIPEFIYKRL